MALDMNHGRTASPRLRWMLPLACLALSLTALPAFCADDEETSFEADSRRWRDATGQHDIMATLIKYHDRQVTLQSDDGKLIDVGLDQLSTPDRVYLARQRRIVRNETARSNKPPSEQGVDASRTEPRGAGSFRRADESQRLFGIDWYSSDVAQKIATREDKPVIWFRVLGDLSGFM